jgi:hypothetical protein
MTTGTCRTCRWWNEGRCDFGDKGNLINLSAYFYIDVPVSEYESDGVSVSLRTGPDFGCVHHSPIIKKEWIK